MNEIASLCLTSLHLLTLFSSLRASKAVLDEVKHAAGRGGSRDACINDISLVLFFVRHACDAYPF